MRPVTGSSLDDYKTLLRGMQADIKAASSVVVVGGGTVGVEVAGVSLPFPFTDLIFPERMRLEMATVLTPRRRSMRPTPTRR